MAFLQVVQSKLSLVPELWMVIRLGYKLKALELLENKMSLELQTSQMMVVVEALTRNMFGVVRGLVVEHTLEEAEGEY
jgi:hypothetical protein